MTSTAKQEEIRTKIENMFLIWSSEVSGQPKEKLHPEVDQLVLRNIDLINQQVLEAIAEIKSKSTQTFIAPTHGVPLSAIEQVEKRYKDEAS